AGGVPPRFEPSGGRSAGGVLPRFEATGGRSAGEGPPRFGTTGARSGARAVLGAGPRAGICPPPTGAPLVRCPPPPRGAAPRSASPRCCVKTGSEKSRDTARNPTSFFMPPSILIVLQMFVDRSPCFHRKA